MGQGKNINMQIRGRREKARPIIYLYKVEILDKIFKQKGHRCSLIDLFDQNLKNSMSINTLFCNFLNLVRNQSFNIQMTVNF